MGELTDWQLVQLTGMVFTLGAAVAYMRSRIGVVERDVADHAKTSANGMMRLGDKLDTIVGKITDQSESIIRIEGYGKVADERHLGYERRTDQIEGRLGRIEAKV